MKLSEYIKKEMENLDDEHVLTGADSNIKEKNGEPFMIVGRKNTLKNIISVAACAVFAVAIAGALLILPGVLPALDTTPGDTGTEKVANSTLTLGEGIFATTDGLYNYYLEDGKAVIIRYIGTEESITIPTEIDGYDVLKIEAYCIEDNTLIRKEKGDFDYTNSLYTENGRRKNQGIVGETPVKHVTVPGTVEVGECAFQNCQNLVSAELIEGSYSVGVSAFSNCESNLVSVKLPSSLSKIESCAFYRCKSLKEITIPGNVNHIDTEAFAGCFSLKNLTIEEGVQTIGLLAFSSCRSLTEVTIPKSVTQIDYGAFEGCTHLEKVTYLSDDVKIADNAFEDTPYAKNALECFLTSADGRFNYILSSSNAFGKAYITRYLGSENTLVIPTEIDGYEVASISGYFDADGRAHSILENTTVESIVIPGSVNISPGIINSEYLKSVTLEEGQQYVPIGAFDGCTSLSEINLPDSVETIHSAAFSNTAIKEITLPENLKTIFDYAFWNCTELTEITIPSGVELIKESAFENCTMLEKVTFLSDETVVAEDVFLNTPYEANN